MRKNIFLLLFSLSFLLYVKVSFSLTCNIRSSCLSNETCIFSLYDTDNSHIASCGYFDYKLCCDDIISASIKDNCDYNEAIMFLAYKENDSHVEAPTLANYGKKVCVRYQDPNNFLNCSVRDACLENETQVITLYNETNAHVGLSYDYKLCCRILKPDLVVNSSSLIITETPRYGDAVELNITIWNIGDYNATNVNVSCYANGTYFDSDIINVAMGESAIARCLWITSCSNNITVKVDPLNLINEHNETNNEASFTINIQDVAIVTINSPKEGENYYRNQTIFLNATVSRFCGEVEEYNVTWYNASMHQIATGKEAYWQIPINYEIGEENIYAKAVTINYGNATSYVTINILNNPPNISELMFEPDSILINESITISCNVSDVENAVEDLKVNISIRNPYGQWNNASASRIGNTFYREFVGSDPVGIYLAKCLACDLDNDCSERNGTFIVYRPLIISINLNATEVWWNESILISGIVERDDGSKVDTSQDPYSDVRIYVRNILSAITETNALGEYNATIYAPLAVGTYIINVTVRDPLTTKLSSNTMQIYVKPSYGEEKKEVEESRNVGCYEKPIIIQNPDGSLSRVVAKVCVLR